jgi:type IV fimbrial biogenesis protein FimT
LRQSQFQFIRIFQALFELVMHIENHKPGRAIQNRIPFVCRLMPFVGSNIPGIIPIIGQNMPSVWNRPRGFTLVELIITVTVIGIIAAIAVPGMNTFMESNRLTTLTNDLIADISLARSEAIKRGVQTAICGSPTSPSCAGGANWNGGWLVFVDADNNGAWSANDIEIKIHETVPQNCTLTPPVATMVFTRIGAAATGSSGTYTICNGKIKKKRDIEVNSLGRTNLTEGSCP